MYRTMSSIVTNVGAINAQRNLGISGMKLGKVLEQLSSGYRINRAADDAAGLGISEKMRSQIRGDSQAIRNAQDGISMVQTAEGAMDEIHSMLQRMRELAVQAANDTYDSAARTSIGQEMLQLHSEIDRIAGGTTFNGQNLLTGSLSTQVGGASELQVATALGAGLDLGHRRDAGDGGDDVHVHQRRRRHDHPDQGLGRWRCVADAGDREPDELDADPELRPARRFAVDSTAPRRPRTW